MQPEDAEGSQAAGMQPARKSPWTTPTLTALGSVRALTTGGSNPGIENDPFGCRNSTVGDMGPCKP